MIYTEPKLDKKDFEQPLIEKAPPVGNDEEAAKKLRIFAINSLEEYMKEAEKRGETVKPDPEYAKIANVTTMPEPTVSTIAYPETTVVTENK